MNDHLNTNARTTHNRRSGDGDNGCEGSCRGGNWKRRRVGTKERKASGNSTVSSVQQRSVFTSKSTSTSTRTSRSNSLKQNQRCSSSGSIRSSSNRKVSSVRSKLRRSSPKTVSPEQPSSSHILCAIGENLARETCIVSLDLSAPFSLTVIKQSNGQSYSETIACLSVVRPHEVLMNEGRYHSVLARKVVGHFDLQRQQKNQRKQQYHRQQDATLASESALDDCPTDDDATVVKFVSRSYFDQTKGAELIKKVARQDTYNSTLVHEYILLSSAHALLHYAQVTLGAVAFARHSVDIRVHIGGQNQSKMEIDRSTLLQLEVLTNNSSCKPSSYRKHSLIATMDCTKTGVGHRLLRTTLMAPPCRLDTIIARLDLVDMFLHDEDLFYNTLEHLQNLASLDNMLTHIVVIPSLGTPQQQHRSQRLGLATIGEDASLRSSSTCQLSVSVSRYDGSSAYGKSRAACARLASKGIMSLVCIKSTLSRIPLLASILEKHLCAQKEKPRDGHINQDQSEDEEGRQVREEATVVTAKASLLMGLGVGKRAEDSSSSSALSYSHSFSSSKDELLRAIVLALNQPELEVIRQTIDGAFTESTSYTRNTNAMKHQECFALRSSEENGMMDILRKCFLCNVDDIYKKADEYAEIYGISHVAVRYSSARGYYLSLPLEMASNLPNVFIQPSKSGKSIFCTTEEVISLNIRSMDNIKDLLLLTNERIQEVLDVARSKYDALALLSDAIALLDLCHSFADKVALSKLPWSRPSLTDGGVAATIDTENDCNAANRRTTTNANTSVSVPDDAYAIAICNGRYGIEIGDADFSSENGPREWIANDTYASLSKSLTIISGINGSGKSTYLKQIAIIVLLAHCGSYVPAEEAFIPLTNRLCARMMTADDQENNISSFLLEMKETAFICKNATSRSLILMDELGRATSNEDGVAIAWAVAETLLAKGAMTYFVTHYPQLCQMSRTYASVQNQHLEASISSDGESTIRYSHKVGGGPCHATSSYGVDMAASCGWPSDVVEEARAIESSLKDKLADAQLCDQNDDIENSIEHMKLLKETVMKLVRCVSTECMPTMDALRIALQELNISMLAEIPRPAIEKCLANV